MYYRYEARIADATKCSSRRELEFRNWTGIFQCFDRNLCRKWYCLTVPKWYEHNLAVPSKAWFTQYGFEKWHSKMLETIRDLLERYPYFEIRILTCTKQDATKLTLENLAWSKAVRLTARRYADTEAESIEQYNELVLSAIKELFPIILNDANEVIFDNLTDDQREIINAIKSITI